MECNYCGKHVNSALCIENGKHICDMCQFLLKGEKLNDGADYSYETHDGIVLWIKDLQIDTCWTDGGSTHVPEKVYKGKKPEDVIKYLRTGIKFCSKCGDEVKEVAGRHFAGIYCGGCWEEYKVQHSRICGLCGTPVYQCCC